MLLNVNEDAEGSGGSSLNFLELTSSSQPVPTIWRYLNNIDLTAFQYLILGNMEACNCINIYFCALFTPIFQEKNVCLVQDLNLGSLAFRASVQTFIQSSEVPDPC